MYNVTFTCGREMTLKFGLDASCSSRKAFENKHGELTATNLYLIMSHPVEFLMDVEEVCVSLPECLLPQRKKLFFPLSVGKRLNSLQ
jgi:hypothetical protein